MYIVCLFLFFIIFNIVDGKGVSCIVIVFCCYYNFIVIVGWCCYLGVEIDGGGKDEILIIICMFVNEVYVFRSMGNEGWCVGKMLFKFCR